VLVNNAGYGYRSAVKEADHAGRSLTQSATPIGDYAATAGKRRKESDTMHGTQPGDPARRRKVIIAVAESAEPPALLVLGKDAFDAFGAVAQAERADLDRWRRTSASALRSRTKGPVPPRRMPPIVKHRILCATSIIKIGSRLNQRCPRITTDSVLPRFREICSSPAEILA
jgi:hypothetical protein